MTRKDYTALASALAKARPHLTPYAFEELVKSLAGHCATHNPRFDRLKFFEACGLTEWVQS
jgi:hypothetical protein